MSHTFSFVIQHPLFNLQPSLISIYHKVWGGLEKVARKSGANELNLRIQKRDLK